MAQRWTKAVRGIVFFTLALLAGPATMKSGGGTAVVRSGVEVQVSGETIHSIAFFGQTGLDIEGLREALPVNPGDPFPVSDDEARLLVESITSQVLATTGKPATDIAFSCCEASGGWTLFIGLPGPTIRQIVYDAPPTGRWLLPENGLGLYQSAMETVLASRTAGDSGSNVQERETREYALNHEAEVVRVLEDSSDGEQREAAAYFIGLVPPTPSHVALLIGALNDSSHLVRNNAVRSLVIMAEDDITLMNDLNLRPLIELLFSGIWVDRDKGSFLLEALATEANLPVLTELRQNALVPLVEIALWPVQSEPARALLSRIGDIAADDLDELLSGGNGVAEIVDALNVG